MKRDPRRLFTVGCSYTAYSAGPTWAELLGLEFNFFENWGIPGIGCRAIAERVAECHATRNFTKDDVVIVQWSTHLRFDYHNPDPPDKEPAEYSWKTNGSIFSPINQKYFDEKWLNRFYYEPSFIMHCLNYILMTQMLLDNVGCTWYMTSIGDWCKLSTDLDFITGSGEQPQGRPQLSIQENIPQYIPWVNKIWNDRPDRWLEPLAIHAQQTPSEYQMFVSPKDPSLKIRELHPSTRQYISWLNQYLRPKLGLGEAPEEFNLWAETVEAIRLKNYNNQKKFWDDCTDRNRKNKPGWWPENPDYYPTRTKGY